MEYIIVFGAIAVSLFYFVAKNLKKGKKKHASSCSCSGGSCASCPAAYSLKNPSEKN